MSLKKVNENFKFLNEYNYLIELMEISNNLELYFFYDILKFLNNFQKKLFLYYFNLNKIENCYIILKNISYKKQIQLKNYYLKDIKF